MWLSENVYYKSGNGGFKRITDNNAAAYNQAQEGTHKFYVAPYGMAGSAISWTTAMTINNNGNIQMRGTDDVRLTLGSNGNSYDNSSNWVRGHKNQMRFNSREDGYLFEIYGTERMRIDSNGKVTIKGDLEVEGSIENVTCSSEIADDSIVNGDINTNAAIAGSKINPNFDDQNISTTGNVGIGASSLDTKLHVNSGEKNVATILESTDETAAIQFKDPDGTAEVGNSGNNIILSPGGNNGIVRISGNENVGSVLGNNIRLDGGSWTNVNTAYGGSFIEMWDGITRFRSTDKGTGHKTGNYNMEIMQNGKVIIKGDLEVEGSFKDVTCSNEIADDSIVNGDINTNAAIAGSKIDPDFGDQNISTTGNVGIGIPGSLSNKLEIGDADGIGYAISIKHKQYGINIETTGDSDYGEHPALRVVSTGIIEAGETNSLFRVSNNGNVGIGTDDPKRPLHIEVSGEGATNELLVLRASDDAYADLVMADKNGSVRLRNHTGQFQIYTGGDGESVEAKNSNIAMRIDENGKVTIKGDLEVEGSIENVTYSSEIADDSIVNGDINTNAAIAGSKIDPDFGDQNISTTGNVGIGASSPNTDLEIRATAPKLRLEDTQGGDKRLELSVSNDAVGRIKANQSSSQLAFETAGSERMRIDANGYVGIGTSSPTAPLTVNNDDDHSDVAIFHAGGGVPDRGLKIRTFSNINANAGVDFNAQHSSGALKFSINSQEAMRIDENGKVGIGTDTPQVNLHIEGTDKVSQYIRSIGHNILEMGTDKDSGFIISRSEKPLFFGTNKIERMRIDENGNVSFYEKTGTTAEFFWDASLKRLRSDRTILTHSEDNDSAVITSTTGNLELRGSGDDYHQFFLQDGGNVGIGTDDPQAKLHVQHSSEGPALYIEGKKSEAQEEHQTFMQIDNLGGKVFTLRDRNYANNLGGAQLTGYRRDQLAGIEILSKNVLSDNSGDNSDEAEASMVFSTETYSDLNYSTLTKAHANYPIYRFNTKHNDEVKNLLTILSGGNVGIGYTTTNYKLDVNGIIRGSNVSASDQRWKKDITTLDNSLDKIAALRGVSYEWKRNEFPDKNFSEGTQIGVIAQEIESVFPELVSEDNEGYKSVSYSNLVAPLIEAVKELKQQNETLNNRVEALEKQQQNLIERLEALENK
jgi:hypothetical protein